MQNCTCVLSRILDTCDQPLRTEILKGAHVQLTEGGTLYHHLSLAPCGSVSHLSSHRSQSKQYRCARMLAPVIYGTDDNGNTWFAFQRHEVTDPCHVVDYCMYLTLNRNVGPLGLSRYTDQLKLVIDAGSSQRLLRFATRDEKIESLRVSVNPFSRELNKY